MYNFRDWRFYLGAAIAIAFAASVWGLWQVNNYFPPPQGYASPEDEDIAKLRSLADRGDADAMYQLVLYYGWDSPKEPVLGWMVSASEADHAGAQNELGNAYLWGWLGLNKDKEKACHWFIKSAEGGEAVGQFNAAYCYRDGIGVEQNDAKASALAYQSARSGYGASQVLTYFRYKEGVGVERNFWISNLAIRSAQRYGSDIEEVVRFELTWQNQDIDVLAITAVLYGYVRSAKGDWDVGLRNLANDARQYEVDDPFCNSLTDDLVDPICALSATGRVDLNDVALQRALWLAAAQLGDAEAQRTVAAAYRTGRVFPQDDAEAEYWRLRASAQEQ